MVLGHIDAKRVMLLKPNHIFLNFDNSGTCGNRPCKFLVNLEVFEFYQFKKFIHISCKDFKNSNLRVNVSVHMEPFETAESSKTSEN